MELDLKKTLTHNDLTAAKLARAIGITPKSVSTWVIGRKQMKPANKKKVIAWLLDHNYKVFYK